MKRHVGLDVETERLSPLLLVIDDSEFHIQGTNNNVYVQMKNNFLKH